MGPYERIGVDFLLSENESWKCMGHGTFVHHLAQEHYYLLHAYNKIGGTYTGREGLLAKLHWKNGDELWFELVKRPEIHRHQDSSPKLTSTEEYQDFWQWDFQHAAPLVKKSEEGLRLSGTTKNDNQLGIALTKRPTKLAYTVGAEIDLSASSEAATKGVVLYGDHAHSVGLSVTGNKIQFWKMDPEHKTVIAENELPLVYRKLGLKITITSSLECHAFFGQSEHWTKIGNPDKPVSIEGIAPWDRSPRPGLLFNGEKTASALFTRFYIDTTNSKNIPIGS